MPTRSYHITAFLGFVLIIAGLCQCTPLGKVRDKRDTRDIPSNLFKPLNGGSSNSESDSTTLQNKNSNDAPFEQSPAQVHVIQGVPQQNVVSQSSQVGDYRYPTRSQGLSSGNNMFTHYNTYENFYGGPFGNGVRSQNNLPGRIFTIQTYETPVAVNYQRGHFPDSTSNHFYHSEYSYNSDGNGPLQFERSK